MIFRAGKHVAVSLHDITTHYGVRKHFHCKSRKRFVKLLMGNGYSRNDANYLAKYAQDKEYSYQSVWKWMIFERPKA